MPHSYKIYEGTPVVNRVCTACGKKFVIPKWVANQSPGRFCSTDCKKGYVEDIKKRLLRQCDLSGGPNSCWVWQGSVIKNSGYGQIQYKGKALKVHRLAWELFRGPIPKGMLVCHSCDNKPCANPKHLFIGTQVDNMQDMQSKGRGNYAHGIKLPIAKLNPQAVREIRKLSAQGLTITQIAKRYGVTNNPVYCILKGKTWKQVK